MRWVVHVALMGEIREAYKIVPADIQGRYRLANLGVNAGLALGQVFSEYFGFPCQSSFHQIFHHHNHPGQV
jgi:hypothetical protein